MQANPATISPALSRPKEGPAFRAREGRIFLLLLCGFALITVLLALDAWVGYLGTASVRSSAAVLAENQKSILPLVEELRQLQSEAVRIEDIIPSISTDKNKTIKQDIARISNRANALFSRVPAGDPETEAWAETRRDLDAELAETSRILDRSAGVKPELSQLAQWRDTAASAIAAIERANLDRAEANRIQIERITRQQSLEDRLLLVACLAVACLFLWSSLRIYKKMNEQAEELRHVSWQLLEKQESLARRLSRDLHDELGQTLTALKTNLSRHTALPCADPGWIQNCNELLRESMQSAHEISQLLRPTLLDDFGLDSALAWLCEKFEERHRIRAAYVSDVRFRLKEHTETQLFRVAQEALTNVARHARASWVRMTFARETDGLRLEISDNGIGLPAGKRDRNTLGLTGMKARVRSIQGEMQIRSSPGRGTLIEVILPLEHNRYEETDSHSAG